MPKLVCLACGRELYAVAALESLFAEERQCPRCGAYLATERRLAERRQHTRRANPPDDPGPPLETGERRLADRRRGPRRAASRGAPRW